MLTREGCQGRLERFRAALADHSLDGAVISDPRDLYYLLGQPLPPAGDFPAAALVVVDGWVLLASHQGPEPLVDAELASYPWHIGYTRNLDNQQALAEVLGRAGRGRRLTRLGYQAEHLPHSLAAAVGRATGATSWSPIDTLLLGQQRAKDPDELALMRAAIAADLAAYDAVAPMVAAGVSELAVLAAGQRAAMEAAGEPVYHDGDYACGELGGPARGRPAQADELYIVDAWTVYRGYWSDLCRTFAVGEPTELQASVHAHLVGILADVAEQLRPGLDGREFARWMDARIREHPHLADTGLIHHAGHGTGLRPHTSPDLNLDRDGLLMVGDTVSVEPGGYSPELRAGVRVENTFLITETGCELLSHYPLSLTIG